MRAPSIAGPHLLLALVAATTCVALTGCGGGDAEVAAPPTVSLTVPSQSLNFSQETAEGFESGVGAVPGVAAVVGGPDVVDPPAQLQVFKSQTAASSAGASVFTTAPDLFAKPFAEAAGRGIPLIAVDNPPLPGSQVNLFIGNDNVQLGRLLAAEIIAQLPKGTRSGTIVIGTTSPGAYVLERRVDGLKAEFAARLPGVTVRGPFETKRDLEANRLAWGQLIETTPDALAFVGTGDADALSLAGWHEQTGGDWTAGGFDLEPRALLAVKRGDLVVVSPEHFLKGMVAGRLLATGAKSGTSLPAGWLRTPGLLVTRSNIDEIIARQASPAAKQKWFAEQADRLLANPPLQALPIG